MQFRHPGLQHRSVVGLAERGARVQDAEADVGRAVADAEDPAVAGKQLRALLVGPVPQFERGSSQSSSCLGLRNGCGAHGDLDRAVVALRRPRASDRRVELPSAAMTIGAGTRPRAHLLPADLAVTPRTRSVRGQMTGPVTLVCSCKRAPAWRACRARTSSKSARRGRTRP